MGLKNKSNSIFRAVFTSAFLLILIFAKSTAFASGDDHCEDPNVDPSKEIVHHITDDHNWHIASIPTGKCANNFTNYFHLEVPLPWIIYDSEKGVQFFMSSAAEEKGYVISHGAIYAKGYEPHDHDGDKGAAHSEGADGHGDHAATAHADVHADAHNAGADHDHGPTILDFSITKTSFQMILVGLLLLLVFTSVAKGYKKNEGHAPKGIQSFMEPIVLFVRNDIARTYLGKKADTYTPYLLTLFFFIWFANLLGLTPLNSNIAGNTSITIALALLTFILILANSTKDFWLHIFWFPGVPVPIKFLMLIVELIGLIVKPTALAIRLFANITAGHFMVLSLISLIFILGKNGAVPAAGWGTAPVAVAFTLAIFALEMVVAIIQAYVFALLTAVFIGQAMETHDDEHH